MDTLDPVVQGIVYLVALVVFVIAAVLARPNFWACLISIGFACFAFVWMWNSFAQA